MGQHSDVDTGESEWIDAQVFLPAHCFDPVARCFDPAHSMLAEFVFPYLGCDPSPRKHLRRIICRAVFT